MQALEVRHLGLITRFNECFVARLHQRSEPATQHDLFAEQVGFGFFGECGFNYTCTAATNGRGVRQRQLFGGACCILRHRNECWHPTTLGKGAAHEVTRTFRGDHDHINTCRGRDALEANIETVGKGECLAISEMLLHVLVVDLFLFGIRGQQHDDVGPLGGVGDRHDLQAGIFGFGC